MTVPSESFPAENRYVSTAQVAAALGVSVTTVKRWVDDGVLPAHKTVGGHRKLMLADVIRHVRRANLPQADLASLLPPESPKLPDLETLRRELTQSLRHPDPGAIRGLIHGAHRASVPVELIGDRLISPALAEIGHGWETGSIDVATEHRASQACISALYELSGSLNAIVEPGRPLALGGAPEHDHYVLPSLLASLTLVEAGWAAVNLGPHTPFAALAQAVESQRPHLVWLSISYLVDPERFLAEHREFFEFARARGIPVSVGGRGLTAELRTRMNYTTFGDGLSHLGAFARSLLATVRRPSPDAPSAN